MACTRKKYVLAHRLLFIWISLARRYTSWKLLAVYYASYLYYMCRSNRIIIIIKIIAWDRQWQIYILAIEQIVNKLRPTSEQVLYIVIYLYTYRYIGSDFYFHEAIYRYLKFLFLYSKFVIPDRSNWKSRSTWRQTRTHSTRRWVIFYTFCNFLNLSLTKQNMHLKNVSYF